VRVFQENRKIALALRSTAVPPPTIVKLATRLDKIQSVSHIFIPEGGPGSFQALDLSSACLAVTTRIKIGSGVIRVLEYPPEKLASRLLTLQDISENRFVLGIGTGRPGPEPSLTIKSTVERLEAASTYFKKYAQNSPRLKMPETYIATLRPGIAQLVLGHSDGIILNFCPPEFAESLIGSLNTAGRQRLTVSCYLKLFFAKDEDHAKQMLVQEFANYDRNPSYHKMFEAAGVAREIASANAAVAGDSDFHLNEKLLKISLANPTRSELQAYVDKFRKAGVDLPCIYPYFEDDEDESFRLKTVAELAQIC
jgi:alkanesulfonate monooxygenase SsuD/methylene tetrahydromethanopterin reductase-like flavin-dependent oxidoreductase (luciferase family)